MVPVNAVQVPIHLLQSEPDLVFYLASPLTLYPAGPDRAYDDVAALSKRMLAVGIRHFSPIIYSYALARAWGRDLLDRDFWLKFDQPMMAICGALMVAEMDSWQTSIGVYEEIDYFRKKGRPIYYIDPQTLAVRS